MMTLSMKLVKAHSRVMARNGW